MKWEIIRLGSVWVHIKLPDSKGNQEISEKACLVELEQLCVTYRSKAARLYTKQQSYLSTFPNPSLSTAPDTSLYTGHVTPLSNLQFQVLAVEGPYVS